MQTKIWILFFNGLVPMLLCAQNIDWLQKGLDAGDPKEQIGFFTKSIETGSDLSAAYFCRASARLGQGDIQGAIDDYSKCIELDSNDVGAFFSRGMAKQHYSVDYQGAVDDIAKVFENGQSSSGYVIFGGRVNRKNEDCHGVIAFYEKVLWRFPDDGSICCKLGYCYLETGKDSLALDKFNKSIALQPEKVDAILGITLVYYYKNDLVNAKKYLNQALALKPILQQGVAGFETFKKEGYIYNDRDNAALKTMFSEWK